MPQTKCHQLGVGVINATERGAGKAVCKQGWQGRAGVAWVSVVVVKAGGG